MNRYEVFLPSSNDVTGVVIEADSVRTGRTAGNSVLLEFYSGGDNDEARTSVFMALGYRLLGPEDMESGEEEEEGNPDNIRVQA